MKSLKLTILVILVLAMFSVLIFATNIPAYTDEESTSQTGSLEKKTIELSD